MRSYSETRSASDGVRIELRLEDIEVLLGLLGLLVQRLEGAQRDEVRRIEVEHLLVRGDRLAGVEQAQVPDRADLEPELDDLARRRSTSSARRDQDVDQRLPLLGAAVQPVERGRAPLATSAS